MASLLSPDMALINLGLGQFADGPTAAGSAVVAVDWQPAGQGDPYLARLCAELADASDGLGAQIAAANVVAFQRLIAAEPRLVDVLPAGEVLAGMTPTTILHAGPPIEWARMCGAMRGGIVGALLYEGLADTPSAAEQLAASGQIQFAPCHSRDAVGPMAGIISASMPV